MDTSKYRIEVVYKEKNYKAEALLANLINDGFNISKVYISDNYLVNIDVDNDKIKMVSDGLIQPVVQNVFINDPYRPEFSYAVEIGFLPGVTDNTAHTVREMAEDILKIKLDYEKSIFSTVTYFFNGDLVINDVVKIANELYNPLIQRIKILTKDEYIKENGMGYDIPVVSISDRMSADEVDLNVSDAELLEIGKSGIKDSDGERRGPLALDMLSMDVIKNYFEKNENRNPTDIEMESIAQTWSEHCKHTIFAASIDDDVTEGIYKKYIRDATKQIRKDKGNDDFCLSVFTDNAGGIVFDDNYIVSDKVETHNSPSALDPFGGSITGIVGVNRDSIGFGMASKPIANRYGFCFANPFDTKPLYRGKDDSTKLLSPRRIMDGVIEGVNAGGNTSGIPTPQGFVYFDDRYKGKPLVFVGTIGLMPRSVAGKNAVEKSARDGDLIVMIGGRVGRDGIHGATFSSEALNSGSPATAVQIGDPITQKKMSDAVVKEARDLGLYNSITDNGAGGLSCSVAEMAEESGGFVVDLEKIPLKYPGLSPWQVWISESQERMTLSVPPKNIKKFISLMESRGVEATVIGTFNSTDRAVVKNNGIKIFDLDMEFLHNGLPKKQLKTTYTKKRHDYEYFEEPKNIDVIFTKMLKRLNIASFEFISTQYDHEVQANSVIKPLQGKGKINGNASVIRPVLDSKKGVVLSQGMYPSYSDIDTYWMAASSIDTSIRNVISVGGSLDELALLDNFCWCDSNNPERLGELKEAAKACYDFAVAYGTPYISGKDSMFNDFKGYDENKNEVMISIPPTLLISSIGVIDNVEICQTLDFKNGGDLIYVIGETKDELGGSEYLSFMGEEISGKGYIGNDIPKVDSSKNIKIYKAFEKAMKLNLFASTISVERGGLAIAFAKSAMAGKLGLNVDINEASLVNIKRADSILFSETQGRFVVSVNPKNKEAFEKTFENINYGFVGKVTNSNSFVIKKSNSEIVNSNVDSLIESNKALFRKF